MPPII